MEENKELIKILEMQKSIKKPNTFQRPISSIKNTKAKTGLKKVGRSRTQKGHKNF